VRKGCVPSWPGQAQIPNEKDTFRHGDVGGQPGGAKALKVGDDLQADDVTHPDLHGLGAGVAFDPEAQ
jgi:hypothetical protein